MFTFKRISMCLAICGFAWANSAMADITVPMYMTNKDGNAQSVGSILIQPNKYGTLFTPNLQNLTPGIHGFHVHQNPSCENNGMAAGDHLDPKHTNKHLGPYNDAGHLGDLPAIYVNNDGTATLPVLAPRIKSLATLRHHALILHAGGDNYQDTPKLGGGGARMVCGIIK